MADAWSLLFILSLLGIFFVLSCAFSTLGRLLSLVRTTDFMYTSASLLNYGLLSVGKYVIKDELDLVLYHPGAPSLVRETDTHIYI